MRLKNDTDFITPYGLYVTLPFIVDLFSKERHTPLVRFDKRRTDMQQRRLPRTAAPDNGEALPWMQRHIDIGKEQRIETVGNSSGFKERFGHWRTFIGFGVF